MTDDDKYIYKYVYKRDYLYNIHKELRNKENYKNHQMVIEFIPEFLRSDNKILVLSMLNNETGEKIYIKNIELQDIEIAHEFDKCVFNEIKEEDTRPRFNSPGYGRVEK